MINVAIVGSSLGSAMKYAAPAVAAQGYDPQHFMREVMAQLGGQGIPGADSLTPTTHISMGSKATVASAPTIQNTGLSSPQNGRSA